LRRRGLPLRRNERALSLLPSLSLSSFVAATMLGLVGIISQVGWTGNCSRYFGLVNCVALRLKTAGRGGVAGGRTGYIRKPPGGCRAPKPELPVIRKNQAIFPISLPAFAPIQNAPGGTFLHSRGHRRRASTLPFFAIRATLARWMNRPCSTMPGMSLSWRARDGGSGIWPKEQSRM